MTREESLMMLEEEVSVLIRRVKRVIGERAQAVHESLQPASYLMLGHVQAHGPLRASTMAEVFDIDKGAISRQVSHLIDLELLERSDDPADARATLLSITSEGARRMADVTAHRRKWLDERLGDWSTEEVEAFVDSLGHYNRALND